jgi:FtsH-binding integral membrane protein
MTNPSLTWGPPVAALPATARTAFLVKVYQHLAAAIGVFLVAEVVLFTTGLAEGIYDFLAGRSAAWLLMLGGFMVVSWLATNAAHDLRDTGKQYAGLFGIAIAESVIFAPFLHYVFEVRDGSATVASAAAITGLGFGGLSVVALVTSKDLSFLRPLVMWGFVLALVLIVGAVLFGFNLGTWFSVAMIGLAGASILYKTQEIFRHFPEQAYVGAAVQLFASLMTLFWYVLRLLSGRN